MIKISCKELTKILIDLEENRLHYWYSARGNCFVRVAKPVPLDAGAWESHPALMEYVTLHFRADNPRLWHCAELNLELRFD